MNKLLETVLQKAAEEALKTGYYKLTGKPRPRESGSIGCLTFIVVAILYFIGLGVVEPRIDDSSSYHLYIYIWPIFVWLLFCFFESPISTVVLAALFFAGRYLLR